jgi:hypothetical protein
VAAEQLWPQVDVYIWQAALTLNGRLGAGGEEEIVTVPAAECPDVKISQLGDEPADGGGGGGGEDAAPPIVAPTRARALAQQAKAAFEAGSKLTRLSSGGGGDGAATRQQPPPPPPHSAESGGGPGQAKYNHRRPEALERYAAGETTYSPV